jgi:hypothetical protein
LQVRSDITEAGNCYGALFRGAAPESITERARQQVGGELFAQLALDVRDLVHAMRSQADG